MKFELKDYQEEAASKILSDLRKGISEFNTDRTFTAVSLAAPTGAGKTVIAAAVIERTLFGDPEGVAQSDPEATFLWLTDDPSLNEQTRMKILEASDLIQSGHLVTLDDSFDQPAFDSAKVYFLNIQKLAKSSNLVNRKEGRRRNVIWDTITNSIKDRAAGFYLIIDEAHRGTGKSSSDRQTIVMRIMNGDGLVAAPPVVLGISATPGRFEDAIESGPLERLTRKVSVPVAAVRESGLIKDVLSISYHDKSEAVETTLVRQAVSKLREMTEAWDAYTKAEAESPVRPALVVQIPPSASHSEVGTLLDVCIDEWPALGRKFSIAHSLESHTSERFGDHAVPYVKPQNIQSHPSIRLILFKEALTTGWDCPRAEVMVSLRRAKDDTYIAQLIGRMVRSPLARRIESDERLNRVRLYLPFFNRVAVEEVKAKLESDEGGLPTDIEIDSLDAPRNLTVPAETFTCVEKLPSFEVPGAVHRSQVSRLHKLAALLSGDKLMDSAIKTADCYLVSVIHTEMERLENEGTLSSLIQDAKTSIVDVLEIRGGKAERTFTETLETDVADIDRIFGGAKQRFRDGMADIFWSHRVLEKNDDTLEAKILTIALSRDEATVTALESAAGVRVRHWLDTYGESISLLSEDKKARYSEVRAMAREPELVHPALPKLPITMSGDTSLDEYPNHLYANPEGNFRVKLDTWEKHVMQVESRRIDFVAWYRNPTGGQRSIRIPYLKGTGFGKLYPDFIVLQSADDDSIRASIIDPHGQHLADTPDKLRGLAKYANEFGGSYGRIVSVIMDSRGKYRMLDLKDAAIESVLNGVHTQEDVERVFEERGSDYG